MVGAALTMIAVCAVPLAVAALIGARAYRVVTGCRHKWGEPEVIRVYDADLPRGSYPVARKYIFRCEHCGAMRKRRV